MQHVDGAANHTLSNVFNVDEYYHEKILRSYVKVYFIEHVHEHTVAFIHSYAFIY